MPTAIHRTWMRRIAEPRIEHHHVIQLVRCVYPLSRGQRPGGHRTALVRAEAGEIVAELMRRRAVDGGIRATDENEARGRSWLTENRRRLKLPDVDFRSILEFRLVGFHEYESEFGFHVEPAWRCLFPDGSMLDYAPGAWQRGLAGRKGRPDAWWRWHIEPKEVAA